MNTQMDRQRGEKRKAHIQSAEVGRNLSTYLLSFFKKKILYYCTYPDTPRLVVAKRLHSSSQRPPSQTIRLSVYVPLLTNNLLPHPISSFLQSTIILNKIVISPTALVHICRRRVAVFFPFSKSKISKVKEQRESHANKFNHTDDI